MAGHAHEQGGRQARSRRGRAAFSLIELVIVVVIIGVIAAIAVPRMSGASAGALQESLQADLGVIQKAIDFYIIEHEGQSPAHPAGVLDTSGQRFRQRLIRQTDAAGTVADGSLFGPYLTDVPANPYNDSSKIRIDGVAAGANLCGWRFDSVTLRFEADHTGTSRAKAIGIGS